MVGEQIYEIQIKPFAELSDTAQSEVALKLENLPKAFRYRGFAKIVYAKASPLRVISVDPIEGNILDYFNTITKSKG